MLSSFLLSGQEGQLLTKNFKFEDGVYLTFEALQQNAPELAWDSVKTNLVTNPQTFITQIEYIIHQKDSIDLASIWGISLGGIPYILVPNVKKGGLYQFAGLRVRGKICYFDYSIREAKAMEMKAYNPLTGVAFRQGTIEREEERLYQKILHFETGEIRPLNKQNVLRWIKDDPALSESVLELDQEQVIQKLFKCLLIYDDRQEIWLPYTH